MTETSKAKFQREFGVLTGAAVGVMAVRTREPFRCIETLREIAFAGEQPRDFRSWSMVSGWNIFNRAKPEEDPTTMDGTANIMPALQAMIGGKNANGNTVAGFPERGIYTMMWPHFALPQLPPMVQQLAEFANTFPEGMRRLVIVVPMSFTLPKELEELIPLLDFEPPTMDELIAVYKDVLQYSISDPRQRPVYSDEQVSQLVKVGIGMTLIEFESAICRALTTHRSKLPNVPMADLIELVMKAKTEVVKRSEVLEVMPSGSMTEVGGLDILKAWVRRRRHCFTDEAIAAGVDMPKGCVLIGPPGTGKSLASKAIANELGVPLIKFDVSRIFGSLVGQSEGRVREALKMIESMAPCVAMLDELDKAFDMNSAGGDSGTGKRVLGSILTFLQDCTKPVFWVMTANRTAGLPSEILRKGRVDEVFAISVPNEDDRKDVLRIHINKRKHDASKVTDLDIAVEKSAGYVPSEIEAAVKEAVLMVYADWKEQCNGIKKGGKLPAMPNVTGQLIADQLSDMKPLSVAFAQQFQEMQTWADNNARPASTAKAKEQKPRTRQRDGGQAGQPVVHRRQLQTGALDG